MADLQGLLERYRDLSPQMTKLAQSGKRILVVTHIDADGLCSGSTVFASLMRERANVVLRAVKDLDPRTIGALEAQKYDFHIFTDLGSTLVKQLEAAFGGRFLVIDHHQISEEDARNASVINAWSYGYDGGKEACSSTMAFYFASALSPTNRDLSPLAVVGALADRQDSVPGRALVGLNREAVREAQSAGLLSVAEDLVFTGRETRPIHESVALTSTPYLKGLTGSKDAVLAALHKTGLVLKEGTVWRTVASLNAEEKGRLTEVIASALGPSEGATEALASLFGEVYTLELEDSFTPLRDAREFGTLLNSCGRMGAAGTGISVCLGDRADALSNAAKTLSEYRSGINRALESLSAEPSRTEVRGSLVLVRAEGLVDEKLLGPVISILTSSPAYREKVLVGSAASGEDDLKISSRVGDEFTAAVNMGLVMRDAAASVDGVGGGHSMAAGAKIPAAAAEQFFREVAGRVAS
jgi:single-stranded-DNA-specific exonuclease